MAKLTEVRNENFDALLERIESGILKGSVTASLEEAGDFREGDARCSVRVFERYSYAGSNRVSLTVTLFQQGDGPVHIFAATAGGSQAMFFKLNTWGEDTFLDKLRQLL